MSDTVEVATPEVKAEPTPAPTREEVREKGWSAKEIEAAEKRGMVQKAEAKPKPEAKAPDAPEPDKPEVKAEETEPKTPERVERRAGLPEFNLTPDQEKAFTGAFGPGTEPRGLYFRLKNERQARQAAQAERDRLTAESAALKARLDALEANKAPAVDEEGNPVPEVDPDDKPLTMKQLRELEEKRMVEQQEFHKRAVVVTEAQKAQEEFAREVYPDFDDAVKRAAVVMQNLETVVPEKWKQAKVVRLIQELQAAAREADKYDLDGYNAAMIAYEIGSFHPDHGKKADKDGEQRPERKADGLTPGQMKRIEENTQRRSSSASVSGGGGRRTVDASEVTVKDFVAMDARQRATFRTKYPDQYERLRRG